MDPITVVFDAQSLKENPLFLLISENKLGALKQLLEEYAKEAVRIVF
jgi:hypothetical protein